MTKSYSLDLRRRVARFVEAGHSCHEAARHFEVSVAFVVRLMAAYRATGSLARQTGGRLALLQARPASRLPDPARGREGRHHHAPTGGRTAGPRHQDHARFDLALVHPPRLQLQKKLCGPANKDAPTCVKPASIGTRSASRACARSRIGSCFSMRPAPPPR